MTEEKAKEYFPSFEKYVFDTVDNIIYLAITKRDLTENNKITDDFYFEIGHGNKTSEIGLFNTSFLDNFNDTLQKDTLLKPDNYENEFVDETELQSLTRSNVKYNPFKDKLKQPNGGCSTVSNKLNWKLSGTLGIAFKLKDYDADFFISNFHVLSNFNSKRFETILHPSKSDTYDIKPFCDLNPIGTLFWYKIDNYTDAAIVKSNCSGNFNGGIRCNEKLIIDKIISPKLGMKVIKCGRTSGLTNGIIRSTHCSVLLKDNRISKTGKRIFKDQILTTCMSLPGDSGSILLTPKGDAIGLLFAGNSSTTTFYNNLEHIFGRTSVFHNNIKMPEIVFDKFIKPN